MKSLLNYIKEDVFNIDKNITDFKIGQTIGLDTIVSEINGKKISIVPQTNYKGTYISSDDILTFCLSKYEMIYSKTLLNLVFQQEMELTPTSRKELISAQNIEVYSNNNLIMKNMTLTSLMSIIFGYADKNKPTFKFENCNLQCRDGLEITTESTFKNTTVHCNRFLFKPNRKDKKIIKKFFNDYFEKIRDENLVYPSNVIENLFRSIGINFNNDKLKYHSITICSDRYNSPNILLTTTPSTQPTLRRYIPGTEWTLSIWREDIDYMAKNFDRIF